MVAPEITLPTDPILDELRKRIELSGSQQATAQDLGISPSLITEILKGRRTASPSLLEKLGYMRITVHVKNEKALNVLGAIEKAIDEQAHLENLKARVVNPMARS